MSAVCAKHSASGVATVFEIFFSDTSSGGSKSLKSKSPFSSSSLETKLMMNSVLDVLAALSFVIVVIFCCMHRSRAAAVGGCCCAAALTADCLLAPHGAGFWFLATGGAWLFSSATEQDFLAVAKVGGFAFLRLTRRDRL